MWVFCLLMDLLTRITTIAEVTYKTWTNPLSCLQLGRSANAGLASHSSLKWRHSWTRQVGCCMLTGVSKLYRYRHKLKWISNNDLKSNCKFCAEIPSWCYIAQPFTTGGVLKGECRTRIPNRLDSNQVVWKKNPHYIILYRVTLYSIRWPVR